MVLVQLIEGEHSHGHGHEHEHEEEESSICSIFPAEIFKQCNNQFESVNVTCHDGNFTIL